MVDRALAPAALRGARVIALTATPLRALLQQAQPRKLRSHASRRAGALLLFTAILLCFAGPSSSQAPQEAEPSEAAAAPNPEEVESRRAAVATSIASLRTSPAPDPEELALLERLERLLSQSLDELARGNEIATQLAAARESLSQPPSEQLGHGPPYVHLDATTPIPVKLVNGHAEVGT